MSSTTLNKMLLTGPPGCGKTTVIERLARQLHDLRLAGFLTRELRQRGTRVGFEAVGLSGGRTLLAHVRSRSALRVGRYGVEPQNFAKLLERELGAPVERAQVYLIDEIGKMECLCPSFPSVVEQLLGGPRPVVATLALKGHGLISELKARRDVELRHVSAANRDALPAQLAAWVRAHVAAPGAEPPD